MSLAAMQDALQTDKCTYILVKLKDGADADAVAARINEALPGNKINLTRDLVIDAQERIPGLNTFLSVLVGLGAFVSTIFVLLSMYTTDHRTPQRDRHSQIARCVDGFIIKTIEGEAFMIGVLGVAIGTASSLAASSRSSAERVSSLAFEFSPGWIAHRGRHRHRRQPLRCSLPRMACRRRSTRSK